MKHIQTILATAGLVVVGAAMVTARADEEGIKLYTSAARGTEFHCTIVNVSAKALRITTSVIGGDDGLALASSGAATVLPVSKAEKTFSQPQTPTGHRTRPTGIVSL